MHIVYHGGIWRRDILVHMFNRRLDFVAIGDTVTDAFIRLKDAAVHCKLNTEDCELCVRFGDKVPFEYVKVVKAVGNAANAAVAASRLGLRSGLVTNLGGDDNGRDCLAELRRNNVVTDYVRTHKDKPTNYHFVLWYEADRTILVNHVAYDYQLPKLSPPPKWIYLTSLASNTYPYHLAIADYLEQNPDVKLAFQPGTFQMKLGLDELKRIYARTDVFVVNVEEAQRILNLPTEKRDLKELMRGLAKFGPKIVVITDNTRGAYMYDGEHFYFVPDVP
jgi:ribokinase